MRRSYGNHKNANSPQRRDRRDDRNDRYSGGDNYRKPMNRGFDRNSSSDFKRPRRDFEDSRNTYQERRDYQHREGGNRFNDRSSGSSYRREDHSRDRDRSFNRHHSPPMRTRDDSRGGFRNDREGPSNRRMSPPPRRDTKPSIKSRLNPPLRSSVRSVGTARSRLARASGGSRILRRNDLRSGLIAKRSAPANRAKDYAKKIRQARLKLNEGSGSVAKSESRGRSSSKVKSEDKSPRKETDGGETSRKQDNDNEEVDYLAIANDVNFDEDENESTSGLKAKIATDDKEKSSKDQTEDDKKVKEEPTTPKHDATSSRHRSTSKELDYKCVHCDMHLSSAQDYRNHLTRRTHLLAMRGVALKVRITLNHLRKVQRDRQLEIEARIKDVENISSKYCIICKLNFRQSKDEHRESEDHKKIRNFLKPNCKICNIQLTSPMKYEMHRCQLEHMRRRQRKHEGSDDEIDLQNLDIGDFKTVDSVGDVDDEKEIGGDEIGLDSDAPQTESEEPKLIGKDYISKVEVNYCSLCRDYLPRRNDEVKAIADHCKTKEHQKYYNQLKRDEKKSKPNVKEEKSLKSPDKSASTSSKHQNGTEDEKSEKKNDKSIDDSVKDDENSKFKRYDEKNDE